MTAAGTAPLLALLAPPGCVAPSCCRITEDPIKCSLSSGLENAVPHHSPAQTAPPGQRGQLSGTVAPREQVRWSEGEHRCLTASYPGPGDGTAGREPGREPPGAGLRSERPLSGDREGKAPPKGTSTRILDPVAGGTDPDLTGFAEVAGPLNSPGPSPGPWPWWHRPPCAWGRATWSGGWL